MINLYELLEAATGQLFGEPAATLFTDIGYDARYVKPGQLYAAVRTERGDGHRFIHDAVEAGAAGIICHIPPEIDLGKTTCVVVSDVHTALIKWVEHVLRRYGTTLILVTGHRNAPLAREALALVLGVNYKVYKSRAGYRGSKALPLAINGLEREHQIAVIELESDHPGDMADIIRVVRPLVGVVTDTAPDQETGETRAMLEGLPRDGLAVLNYNDPLSRAMAGASAATTVTFGLDEEGLAYGADLMAYNLQVTRRRTAFDLRRGAERYLGRWVPLLGAHQLIGVLPALQIGLAYGVPLEVGTQMLTELQALPGRMRALEGTRGCQLIDDTRDATTESTLQALDWMENVRGNNGRAIFIMGDVAAADTPQSQMRALEQRVVETADILITQGRHPAQVSRAAVARGMPRDQVHMTFSHADAITYARERLKPNDLLVVVGGAQACMERVLQGLLLHPADAEHLVARSEAADPGLSTAATARSWHSWVEIDLAAIAENVRLFKKILGPDIALMAAVRADAYGHGAVEVGATAVLNGADYLGVASIDEGVNLRESGVDAPILVMGYAPAGLARSVIDHDLTVTLFDAGTAQAFQDVAKAFNARVRVHYHVDTGLGRLGVPVNEIPTFFRAVANLDYLHAEGLYTRLAGIDRAKPARIRQQIATFRQVIDTLAASGIRFAYRHAADTAAAILLPESRFSMVRAGSGIYGLNPSPAGRVRLPEGFRPAMAWKTRVVQVKTLPAGAVVGHSDDYTTHSEETIAVIPVGCTDGLHGDWPCALVRGQRAPLAGPIGMDHATLNVTSVPGVSVGDEVVLLGRQDEQVITVDMVATALGVVNHAIVTGILPRRPDCRVIKG